MKNNMRENQQRALPKRIASRSACSRLRTAILWATVSATVPFGVLAQGDFADDSVDIVNKLARTPSSESTTKSLFISPAEKVTVMVEDATAKGARVIGVVERRENTPRVDLKVEFDVDSHTLRPATLQLLQELISALDNPKLKSSSFAINGHTDSTGSEQHNLNLSYERAYSVRDYLVSAGGIDINRLEVVGFGEAAPIENNGSSLGRQLNRRVEVARLP